MYLRKMKLLLVVFVELFLSLLVPFVESYKILGLVPYNGKSHFVMLEPIFKELAARGHEVDVLSHFPQQQKIPRYTDYSLKGTLPNLIGNVRYDFMSNRGIFDNLNMLFNEYGVKMCENAFNSTIAKEIRDSKKSYDLIITEIFFFECMYGFSHHFQTPVVAISTNADFPWGARRIGNPNNPSYIPNYFLPYLSKMNLYERTWNTIYYLISSYYYNTYALDRGTELARKFFNDENMPHLRDLVSNRTSFMLINTHPSINYAAPKVPNFIEIAGIHINPPKPLPENLEKVLNIEDKYKGVVYMSFGSLIAPESLPLNILKSFFEAFKVLPYKILFKGPAEKITKLVNVSDNVHFEKWMPQRDVLCHPNVKLFVSHGGLMGTQEGIYCGLPTLGLPIFADQELNIANSQARGLAVKLNLNDVTKTSFLNALKTLLDNPSFKRNAERTSRRFRDRPSSALDTAIYWIEYVLNHEGALHLRSAASDMSWYEYFLIDVFLVLTSLSISLIGCSYMLIVLTKKLVFDRIFPIRADRKVINKQVKEKNY